MLAGDLRNARVITALNKAALHLGLRHEMTLADACAMHPSLLIGEADAQGDAECLSQIADWCERYTPLVGLDASHVVGLAAPHGLLLDITGCAHLFGDEERLAADLKARLWRRGFHSRIGMAATVGCAWAHAHHARGRKGIFSVAQGAEKENLSSLPLAALRLAPELLSALMDMGFHQIGDIKNKPRAPLAARFGQGLLRRLDQAWGVEDEPINPRRPKPDFLTECRFAEPLLHEAHLLEALSRLAAELAARLEQNGLATRHVEASLFHVDGRIKRIALKLSRATQDAAQIARLFTDRLAALGDESDPGFGFDMLRLGACSSEPQSALQTGFGETNKGAEIAQFLDRLGARFGSARIMRLQLQDTHVPERAAKTCPAIGFEEKRKILLSALREQDSRIVPRPVRLLRHPELVEAMAEVPDGPPLRFRWRRVMHEVAHVEGPERIAMEWWREGEEAALTRDYFRVEDKQGLRLWLYRDGLYGRETAQPRWYVHGLFA